MTYIVICSVTGCRKVYQDWGGLRSEEEIERSLRGHLTGKHNLSGEAFQKAYKQAERRRKGFTLERGPATNEDLLKALNLKE